MKPGFFATILFLTLFSCKEEKNAAPLVKQDVTPKPITPLPDSMLITILDMPVNQYNFGKVKEGAILKTKYRFYNRGNFPLKIRRITGACSCTTYDYPEVVMPGDSAYFNIKFDTKEKNGAQIKYLTIVANTEPSTNEIMYTADVQ